MRPLTDLLLEEIKLEAARRQKFRRDGTGTYISIMLRSRRVPDLWTSSTTSIARTEAQ
jgi:hypothetical protein